ncbi:MAG: transketolase C-terminal domain-containing protein [Elusimicrobia bacterium]|nr:transketolase C-terminal domain-containing protein [Elusimicrobiota bacterium]
MGKATREAFGEALVELADKFPGLVVLDSDLSKSTMTVEFAKRHPERHFEFGIAESNMIAAAAGLALMGKIPVCTSFACFLVGRLETIRVAVTLNRANVKLVGTHAGLGIGDDGASQMGLEDVAAMRSLPGMTILQPGDAAEARQAVEWMLQHQGPVYLRLTRQKLDDVHGPDYRFACGRLDVVWQPQPQPAHFQATVLASGGTVGEAVAAAKGLQPKGFAVRVVNAGTLAPFDADSLEDFVKDSERLVTVEDHNIAGGLGSAACEAATALGAGRPVVRLGVRETGESGTPAELYERHGLSAPHIMEACIRNLE